MSEFTERLRDENYAGPLQHLRSYVEIDELFNKSADIIDELENPSDETIAAMDKAISQSDYAALRYEVPDEEILRIFNVMVRSVLGRA